jgi:hypothetical protein
MDGELKWHMPTTENIISGTQQLKMPIWYQGPWLINYFWEQNRPPFISLYATLVVSGPRQPN